MLPCRFSLGFIQVTLLLLKEAENNGHQPFQSGIYSCYSYAKILSVHFAIAEKNFFINMSKNSASFFAALRLPAIAQFCLPAQRYAIGQQQVAGIGKCKGQHFVFFYLHPSGGPYPTAA